MSQFQSLKQPTSLQDRASADCLQREWEMLDTDGVGFAIIYTFDATRFFFMRRWRRQAEHYRDCRCHLDNRFMSLATA